MLLNPYFRFNAGRLLMFNRWSNGQAEYIDYLTDQIDDPAFLSFPETENSFLSPSSVGNEITR